MKNKKTIN